MRRHSTCRVYIYYVRTSRRPDIATIGSSSRPAAQSGRRQLEKELRPKRRPSPRKDCPFENLQKSGNDTIFAAWPNTKKWQIVAVPNKYPALVHGESCAIDFKKGMYTRRAGIGTHELIITRDHNEIFRRSGSSRRRAPHGNIPGTVSRRERRLQCLCGRILELWAIGRGLALASSLSAARRSLCPAACDALAPRRAGILPSGTSLYPVRNHSRGTRSPAIGSSTRTRTPLLSRRTPRSGRSR